MAAVRATVILGTWPPPTIEHHALLAVLNGSTGDAGAEPATVFQHLNEVNLSFSIDASAQPSDLPDDVLAQKVVHDAMAQVYDGPISVTLELDQPATRPSRQVDLRPDSILRERLV